MSREHLWGLRQKLLLPAIVSMSLFGAFLHFYWAPQQIQYQCDALKQQQSEVLGALEPDLIRHLLASDLAAIYATLDRQMQVHAKLWRRLSLFDSAGQRLYPLDTQPSTGAGNLISVNHPLDWEGDHLGELRLLIDGERMLDRERGRVRQLELLAILAIGLLIIGVSMVQERLIRRPLKRLTRAADQLRGGDYQVAIPDFGRDEVGQLARAFRDMRGSLIRELRDKSRTAGRLRDRLEYEQALAACSQTLMEDGERAVEYALSYLLNASKVSRVAVYEKLEAGVQGAGMRQVHEVRDSSAGYVNISRMQELIYAEALSRWRGEMEQDRPIAGPVSALPPAEQRVLKPLGIHSILLLPIWVDGGWYGAISFDDSRSSREWDEEDILLLRTAADMLGGYLHRKQTESLRYQAFHDPLTGLPNRRMLCDYLQRALAQAQRHLHLGAVLFIDLDRFKVINDSLGHRFGDGLLEQVAKRLQTILRRDDIAARLGGDEFVVLLSELGETLEQAVEHAQSVAEKLGACLSQPYRVMEHELHVTSSIGIVLFPTEAESTEEILKRTDNAMYRAKGMGGNTFCFFHPSMQTAADARLAMEKDLRLALQRDEFVLHFQPQVDVVFGRIIGVEALLRWNHPQRGSISPLQFIPVAEESGLILALGEWVLETACGHFRSWANEGITGGLQHMAINVSPREFQRADFAKGIIRVLEKTGSRPERLELELTEGMLIENVEDAIAKINALRALGVGFSIDDFGTGYSSLGYLKRLPLDKLKIDRSFVRDVTTNPNDAAIVEATIAIASHLGIAVVAEGVESREQVDFLRVRGCRICQGYYLGRAQSAEEFTVRLRAEQGAIQESVPRVVGHSA